MDKKFIIAYFICVCPFFVFSQNISGFWKGGLDMNRGCFAENNIELQFNAKGDSLFGSSYHYLDVNYYVKKKFIGVADPVSKKFIIEERVVFAMFA
jgi:hypothetical protein